LSSLAGPRVAFEKSSYCKFVPTELSRAKPRIVLKESFGFPSAAVSVYMLPEYLLSHFHPPKDPTFVSVVRDKTTVYGVNFLLRNVSTVCTSIHPSGLPTRIVFDMFVCNSAESERVWIFVSRTTSIFLFVRNL
jgi:hypothetical protein